jgi:hypothetical protein
MEDAYKACTNGSESCPSKEKMKICPESLKERY